jgi:sodium-dependent dicarboxylate transporter 2/3/5
MKNAHSTSSAAFGGLLSLKGVGLVLALAVVAVGFHIPETQSLSKAGVMSLVLLLAGVVLWCFSTFPLSITGILILLFASLFGVIDAAGAFAGFGTTTFIYVIAIFGLPAILMKTNWGLRLVNAIFRVTGPSSSRLVFSFMAAAGILSAIMADTPTIVVLMGPAYVVIRSIKAKPGQSSLAKALFLGIPAAAFIGGLATPAGSSSNVVAIGMLEQATGYTITFLQWTLIGFPVAVVMIPVFWFFLVRILKPEPITQELINTLNEEVKKAGAPTFFEKKVLFMLLVIPLFWLLGNWVPAFKVTTVAVIGVAVMMMPGM